MRARFSHEQRDNRRSCVCDLLVLPAPLLSLEAIEQSLNICERNVSVLFTHRQL